MIPDILKNMNLFVDGRGYAGKVAQVNLPKLAPVVQEYKAGGFSAPVDVPMSCHEKLEAEFTVNTFDPDIITGFNITKADVPFTMRGAVQDDDGTTHTIIASMRGLIKELDAGDWKSGEESTLKVGLSLRYYRLERDGLELIEADPENMVFRVNGTDQLEAERAALGI